MEILDQSTNVLQIARKTIPGGKTANNPEAKTTNPLKIRTHACLKTSTESFANQFFSAFRHQAHIVYPIFM
jgi:hypothetical protein